MTDRRRMLHLAVHLQLSFCQRKVVISNQIRVPAVCVCVICARIGWVRLSSTPSTEPNAAGSYRSVRTRGTSVNRVRCSDKSYRSVSDCVDGGVEAPRVCVCVRLIRKPRCRKALVMYI